MDSPWGKTEQRLAGALGVSIRPCRKGVRFFARLSRAVVQAGLWPRSQPALASPRTTPRLTGRMACAARARACGSQAQESWLARTKLETSGRKLGSDYPTPGRSWLWPSCRRGSQVSRVRTRGLSLSLCPLAVSLVAGWKRVCRFARLPLLSAQQRNERPFRGN
jgi:hypothetical protein